MFTLLGRLHLALFRLVLWLLKMPLVALWALLLSVVALLGQEVRRWLGILVAGLMIAGVSWAVLKVAADQVLALLVVMLLGFVWLFGVFRALRLTMANRIWKVRQQQAFKDLRGEVRGVGDRLQDTLGDARDGLARRAKGTPAEGLFWANRDAKAKAEADAQVAAAQAEREQAAATEWEQAVAAKRAERERFAAAAADRWADQRRA